MNVVDAMTPRSELVTVSLPGSRDDALEYLQNHEFSSVPVVKQTDDGEIYRGLVSREDLIEHPEEDQLALLMRETPTVASGTNLRDVAQLMLEGVRRVPVVEADNDTALVGIITVTDMIKAIARRELETDATCGDVAAREVNAVYAGSPLTVAERELSLADLPYAVCLDDDCEMEGVLTEADIIDVARVVEGEASTGDSIAGDDDDWKWESIKAVGNRYLPTRNVEIPAEPVARFMTDDVLTVSQRRSVEEAAQSMIEHDVEQLPLMSGGELLGVVRDTNLLRAL